MLKPVRNWVLSMPRIGNCDESLLENDEINSQVCSNDMIILQNKSWDQSLVYNKTTLP